MLNTGAVRHPYLGPVIEILLVWHLFTDTFIVSDGDFSF